MCRQLRYRLPPCPYDVGILMVVIVLALILALLLTGCVVGELSSVSPSTTEEYSASGVGVYEIRVGNSLYPKSRGASIGFQRYLGNDEEITGSFEWSGGDAVYYKWSLYVYAPDGSIVLECNGKDLKHRFQFTPTLPGTYKLEILKRDPRSRGLRLTIDPPDWERWGR
jgi:hypothetical protein